MSPKENFWNTKRKALYNLLKSLIHVFSLPLPSLPRKLESRASKLKASSARSLGFCAQDEVVGEEMRLDPGRARREMGSETPCVGRLGLHFVIWNVLKRVGHFGVPRGVFHWRCRVKVKYNLCPSVPAQGGSGTVTLRQRW